MAVKPVKVSQLNGYIKRVLQTDPILGNVSVIGEISNLKFHGSGHVYFSLKDEGGKINCFLAAGNLHRIRFELAEGMEITATGYVSVYERGGSYSLNIRDIEVAGMGDLAIAFEKLKEKLAARGMFDTKFKKPLPAYPEKIAIVTSETGAAVRDMLKIITTRSSTADVLVYPVLVQGPAAAGEISSAIDDINENIPDVDVIITGRGGGSMEELWAFNEECVAESIFFSKIPVISAVGHETDFTIADFVADVRAETPTAAAQMAVPDTDIIREYLSSTMENMGRNLSRQIPLMQMKADAALNEIITHARVYIDSRTSRVEALGKSLQDLNPKAIMSRGYSVVTGEDGKLIKSVDALDKNQKLNIAFTDGTAGATVDEIRRKDDE